MTNQTQQRQAQGKPPTKVCGVPDCTAAATTSIEAAVAPGVSFDMPVCATHKGDLDQARKDAEAKALAESAMPLVDESNKEAPYGYCHLCSIPVGVISEANPFPVNQDEAVLTWWVHAADKSIVCHETCFCSKRRTEGHFRMRTVLTREEVFGK